MKLHNPFKIEFYSPSLVLALSVLIFMGMSFLAAIASFYPVLAMLIVTSLTLLRVLYAVIKGK
jgi:hypothetical protein